MKSILKILMLLSGVVYLSSCSNEFTENLTPTPVAYGKINELVLVADKAVWDSPVGDTLRYYLAPAYIILPQPEPILDIRFYTPDDLKAVSGRKNFRSYLFIGDLSDASSATSNMIKKDVGSEAVYRFEQDPASNLIVGSNKWATDQILIYQFANNKSDLIDNVKKNAPAILRRVNKHDLEIVEANIYQGGINTDLASLIRARMGVDMKVPFDYFLALNDTTEQTIWLRKETNDLSSNIMIHKFPYTDAEQLSREGIKGKLNKLGLYVSTSIERTYKHINDVDLPMYTANVKLDDKFAVETRGIWEIVNDFMGGPFISYAILNPKSNEVILIEGFVHAPGKEKRNFMQRLEYIFRGVKL